MPRHVPEVRTDHRANPAASLPVGFDLQPLRVDRFDQIVANGIGHRFEVDPLVAETVVVELEGLEFDADAAGAAGLGHVPEGDHPKVRVPGDGADAGKLLGDMFNYERRIGRGREDFKE